MEPEVNKKNDNIPDLDFHVQFPTPETTTNEKIWPLSGDGKNNNEAGAINGENKELLVVLLGWAGSSHKYLSKYSDFYLKQGCVVLRYICPLPILFTDSWKLPGLANRLVTLLKDLQLESHPMFIHTFSNGGGFMYSALVEELAKAGDREGFKMKFKGTIFDSSPAPRNLTRCYFALSEIFSSLSIFKWIISGLIVWVLVVKIFWHHFKSAVLFCTTGDDLEALRPGYTGQHPLQDWLKRISRTKNHSFLFLYSEADTLIPSHQVEQFADIVESLGSNRVTKVNFVDSEHCQHYRKYPERYGESVIAFIRETMKGNYGETVFWKDN